MAECQVGDGFVLYGTSKGSALHVFTSHSAAMQPFI